MCNIVRVQECQAYNIQTIHYFMSNLTWICMFQWTRIIEVTFGSVEVSNTKYKNRVISPSQSWNSKLTSRFQDMAYSSLPKKFGVFSDHDKVYRRVLRLQLLRGQHFNPGGCRCTYLLAKSPNQILHVQKPKNKLLA